MTSGSSSRARSSSKSRSNPPPPLPLRARPANPRQSVPCARQTARGRTGGDFMLDTALRERLLGIYATTKTIAVVGASADPTKAAHVIPRYLQSQGYRILPVNPRGGELFGEPVFRSLTDIDGPRDVVDVFRPPDETPGIARQPIAVG